MLWYFGVFVKPTRRWAISMPRGRFLWDTPYLQLKAVPLLWSYLFFPNSVMMGSLLLHCCCVSVLWRVWDHISCMSQQEQQNWAENSFLQQSTRKAKSGVSKKYICNSLTNLNREKTIDRQCTNSSCNKLLSSYWFLQPPPIHCTLHSQDVNYSLPVVFQFLLC